MGLLLGCLNLEPARDEVRWHVLPNPDSEGLADSVVSDEAGAWFVRAVRLPDYWQGNQIVFISDENELQFLQKDRWGEPLADGLGRFFATAFAQHTNQMVAYYPLSRRRPEDSSILLSFSRLDPVHGQGVLVDVFVERSFPSVGGDDSSEQTTRHRHRFVYGDGTFQNASEVVVAIQGALAELVRRVTEKD